MAQSGYTPILIYASGTASALPSAANLTSSANGAELALNYADGKLYYKNSSGVVTLLASAAAASGTSPGGSTTQVQYNNSGAFAGSANFVWDNSNVRLGIGTSSPVDRLTVENTSTAVDISVIGPSSSQAGIRFGYTGATYQGRVLYDNASNYMAFNTNGSERMRIDSSGSVGIGTSSPSDVLTVGGLNAFIRVDRTGNEPGIEFRVSSSTTNRGRIAVTTSGDMYFTSGGATERVRISAAGGFSVGTTADPGAGAIYATGAITAFYSDRRLKDVKGTIINALDKVSNLSGVYYTNNEVAVAHGYTSAETQVGLLAQDVEAVLPEVVKAAPFDLDEKGNSKSGEHYKTIQYERVIPLLVEAIKELRAEIQALRG